MKLHLMSYSKQLTNEGQRKQFIIQKPTIFKVQ